MPDIEFTYLTNDHVTPAFEAMRQQLIATGAEGAAAMDKIQAGLDRAEKSAAAYQRRLEQLKSWQAQVQLPNSFGYGPPGGGNFTSNLNPNYQNPGAARVGGLSFAQPADFNTQKFTQGLKDIAPAAEIAEKKLKAVDSEMRSKKGDSEQAAAGINRLVTSFLAYRAVELFTQALRAVGQELLKTIEVAATYEDRLLAISNVFGSLEQGRALLEQTRQAAFDTATSFDLLSAGEQRLLNAGMAADKVIPTLKALAAIGKANGATQEQLNGALTAYVQIQEKQVLQSEEARRQLSNRFIPALQLYAQATHKTMEQVNADMKAGKISADQFFDAINQAGMSSYGAALQGSTQSLHGTLTNLGNAVQQLEQVFGQSAMEHALPGLQHLLEVLREPQTQHGVEVLGRSFGDLVGKGADFTGRFAQGVSNLLILMERVDKWSAANTGKPLFGFVYSDDQAQATIERLNASIGTGIKFTEEAGHVVIDYKDAIDQLRQKEDELRRAQELSQRVLDDRIAALQKQNDQLEQQKSLQEKLRGLATTDDELRKARRDAVNIYTSYGQSQADKLPGLAERAANQSEDIMTTFLKLGNTAQMNVLKGQSTANQRGLQDTLYGMDQYIKDLQTNGAGLTIGSPLYNRFRQYMPPPGGLTAPGNTSTDVVGAFKGIGSGWTPYSLQAAEVEAGLSNGAGGYSKLYPSGWSGHTGGGSFGGGQSAYGVAAYCPSCMANWMLNDPRFATGLSGVMYQHMMTNR